MMTIDGKGIEYTFFEILYLDCMLSWWNDSFIMLKTFKIGKLQTQLIRDLDNKHVYEI